MYTELLKLCAFEEEEIERERPRIDEAFRKLGIGSEDIERAERRIRKNYDTELEGVRRSWGIALKEMFDWTLAKEEGKKVIYGGYPPMPEIFQPVMCASEDLYAGTPENSVMTVMLLFDKFIPVLQAAEECGLSAGQAHCTIMKGKLGAIVKGIIPQPDLLCSWVAYGCDQSPRTDELIHRLYGTPTVFADSVCDQNWGDYPNVKERRIEHMGAGIDRLWQKVEEVFGCRLTEECHNIAIRERHEVLDNFLTLIDFNARCDPAPLGWGDLTLFHAFSNCGTLRKYTKEVNRALTILMREAKERFDQGKGVVEKGAPKVLWFAPSAGGVVRLMQQLGVAIIPFASFYEAKLQRRDDLKYTSHADRIAEGWLSEGPGFGSEGFVEYFKETCKSFEVDGFVYAYLYFCRPLSICAHMATKAIEDELNIPVLSIEWDPMDKREYGVKQLATRLETFAELVKARKKLREIS
jgi:benzoyl-CoA reductase/2-hydroxyglutaryl-CoA dehydratase subunit BcrC/BadD/HgdB